MMPAQASFVVDVPVQLAGVFTQEICVSCECFPHSKLTNVFVRVRGVQTKS